MENIIERACGWRERQRKREREDRSHVGVETARFDAGETLWHLFLVSFSRAVSFSQPTISRRPDRYRISLSSRPSRSSILPSSNILRHLSVFSLLSEILVFVSLFISFARVIITNAEFHLGPQKRPLLPFSSSYLFSFSVSYKIWRKWAKTRI